MTTKLFEKDGYTLLLIKIESICHEGQFVSYITGLPSGRVESILNKPIPSILDFEIDHIIQIFDPDEEITQADINSAIDFFTNHFIRNEQMKLKMDYQKM